MLFNQIFFIFRQIFIHYGHDGGMYALYPYCAFFEYYGSFKTIKTYFYEIYNTLCYFELKVTYRVGPI